MPNELATKRWKQNYTQSPGELLKMLRGRAKMTQAALAELLGFNSPRMIRNWEGDFYLPTPERLQRLIEVYLSRQVFLENEEHAEAELLWNTVKNWFETHTDKLETFPIFDHNWFLATLRKADLYEAAGALATNSKPVILTLPSQVEAKKNNLPISLSSFVGRTKDIQQLTQLLVHPNISPNRLIAVVGAGGSGKTRLALETANELVRNTPTELYKDGIWLIELAGLQEGSLIAQTIANVLGVELAKEQDHNQIEKTLVEFINTKDLLLVLDNCEHLIAECARLTTVILSQCCNIRILATSREAFDLNFETVYLLGGLSLPDRDSTTYQNLQELTQQVESAKLFLERAKNKRIDLENFLQEDIETEQANLQAIVSICRYLDGLPLALELAGALISAFTPLEIANQLAEDDLFGLLASGERTAASRHQTLQATINWSYNLLSAEEQLVFRRLAVFNGGWTLEAAQEVCTLSGVKKDRDTNRPFPKISKGKLTACLHRLISKSLIVAEPIKLETNKGLANITTRYRYLEVIRQFILGKFADTTDLTIVAEWEELQVSRASYYINLVQKSSNFWRSKEEKLWQKRLDQEIDNLRAVLRGCQNWQSGKDKAALEQGLELCGALGAFWQVQGHLAEGREHIEAILTQGRLVGLENSQAFLKALNSLTSISLDTGDYKTACHSAMEVIEKAKLGGFLVEQAEALRLLGVVMNQQGNCHEGINYLEQSLEIFSTLDDKAKIAQLTLNLGTAAIGAGEVGKAKLKLLESLPYFEKAEDLFGLGRVYNSLGNVFFLEKDHETAIKYFEKSLEAYQELDYQHGAIGITVNLGKLALIEGNYDKAKKKLRECISILIELKDNFLLTHCFTGLVAVALCEENWTEARQWLEKGLELARLTEGKVSLAEYLVFLGWLEINAGNYEEAKTALAESVGLRLEMGIQTRNTFLVICLGRYAVSNHNNLEGVARSIGTLFPLPTDGRMLMPFEQKGVAEIEEKARAVLGEAVFDQLLKEGKGWSLEQLAASIFN